MSEDVWEGTDQEPCPRCKGICLYCIVGLRQQRPATDLHITSDHDPDVETTLHLCAEHKRFMLGPAR